jgi:hypothetical protein
MVCLLAAQSDSLLLALGPQASLHALHMHHRHLIPAVQQLLPLTDQIGWGCWGLACIQHSMRDASGLSQTLTQLHAGGHACMALVWFPCQHSPRRAQGMSLHFQQVSLTNMHVYTSCTQSLAARVIMQVSVISTTAKQPTCFCAAFLQASPAQPTCVAAWAQPVSLRNLGELGLEALHVEAPQARATLQHGIATRAAAAGAHLRGQQQQVSSLCVPAAGAATAGTATCWSKPFAWILACWFVGCVALARQHTMRAMLINTCMQCCTPAEHSWYDQQAAPHSSSVLGPELQQGQGCSWLAGGYIKVLWLLDWLPSRRACRLAGRLTAQASSSSSESGSSYSSSMRYTSSPGRITRSSTTTCFRGTTLLLPALGPRLALGVAAAALRLPWRLLGVAAGALLLVAGAGGAAGVCMLLRVARAAVLGLSAALLLPKLSLPMGVARLGWLEPPAAAVAAAPVRVLRWGVSVQLRVGLLGVLAAGCGRVLLRGVTAAAGGAARCFAGAVPLRALLVPAEARAVTAWSVPLRLQVLGRWLPCLSPGRCRV